MELHVVLFLALPVLVFSFDCTGQSDGHYEISCKTYYACSGGVGQLVECPENQVYNHETKSCYNESEVDPPCGLVKVCSNKDDGKYADEGCESFYTCHNNYYYGHTYCSEGLVFDEDLDNCNWPVNVKPPCGTKTD